MSDEKHISDYMKSKSYDPGQTASSAVRICETALFFGVPHVASSKGHRAWTCIMLATKPRQEAADSDLPETWI